MALVTILFFLGCVEGLPLEPTALEDSLVIGKISYEGTGFKKEQNLPSLNGSRSKGIELTLEAVASDETIAVVSKSEGFFFAKNLDPGEYSLAGVYIKITADDGGWVSFRTTLFQPIVFVVEPGKVINLGVWAWEADGSKTDRSSFRQVSPPEALREYLAEKKPDSGWLNREWISVN